MPGALETKHRAFFVSAGGTVRCKAQREDTELGLAESARHRAFWQN